MSSFPHAHFNNISWPSLYSPAIEVAFFGAPARSGGYYLSDPDDIFKFTLYWTLIFHLPFSFIAGAYAFFNFVFPPARNARETITLSSPIVVRAPSQSYSYTHTHSRPGSHSHSHSRPQSQSHSRPPSQSQSQSQRRSTVREVDAWLKPHRTNARRSRWAFALLVFFAFLWFSLLSAVVGAAVVAFVLVGVYRAGGFYMSTWIPFVWAGIQSLIALLEIWPSIIDII